MEFQMSYLKSFQDDAVLNIPANLENSAVATGLQSVSFHSNPKEVQDQNVTTTAQLHLPHMLGKVILKIFKLGFNSMWNKNFQMYKNKVSRLVVSDSLWPHGLEPTRLLCPWNSPGKNSGVSCHFLLQGTFPTQGSNPGHPHCNRLFTNWATREALSVDVQARFKTGRGTRDKITNIHLIKGKTRDSQKNMYFCFTDYTKAFDCVDHKKLWKEMGIPDSLICLLRNLYTGQEARVRTGHRTMGWFKIGKGVYQGCILSPCLFNIFRVYHMKCWAGWSTSWNQDCREKY